MKVTKVIATLLCIVMLLSTIVYAESTQDLNNQKQNINEQINDAKNKQTQIKQELSETMQEIQKLSSSIAESEEKLAELTKEVNKLEEEIKVISEELKQAEEEFEKQRDLLETRLIAQYKSGKTSYLDVLLNSTSITDFISRYHYVTMIAQKDTDLLNEMEDEKERIQKAKTELEQKESEFKIKKANAEKENVVLKNNQALKESYVAKLNDDEKELQNQIDTYTSELRKIDAAIRAAEQSANLNSGGQTNYNKYTGGTMAWPTRITKRVNSIYAPYGRSDTYGYYGSAHRGVDINAPYGTSIYAAADGQVIYVNKSGYGGGYGLYVVISHGNNVYTLYGHGSSIPGYIDVGTVVDTDTVIMYAGATGAAEGAHLHFEVWEGRNNRVNPCPYLGIENREGYVY